MDKPLFIPLITKYYEAFLEGNKNTEYRQYGARWNEKTCAIGREVALSKGYCKANRISGKIESFNKIKLSDAPVNVASIYPDANKFIAAIKINELKKC